MLATFSFDDGSDADKKIIDVFNKHAAPATFYLILGRLTRVHPGHYSDKLVDVVNMYRGFEIGSHTFTHPRPGCSEATYNCQVEIMDCRHSLSRIFDHDVRLFAYPYGLFSPIMIKSLQNNGFWWARTYDECAGHAQEFYHPYVIPVSVRYDSRTLLDKVRDVIHSQKRHLHVGGHAHHLGPGDENLYDEAIEICKSAGYEIVPNGVFFDRLWQENHGFAWKGIL